MQKRVPAVPEVLWSPPPDVREHSEIGRFLDRVEAAQGLHLPTYADLWEWSVSDLPAFWSAIRDHFETWPDDDGPALADATMPGARWFPDARMNYAERALRLAGRDEDDIVVVSRSQTRGPLELSVRDLREQVARARAGLRRLGVGSGDHVAAYLPNIPETLIAFLATASLGATWSSCPPEFGTQSVVDRLGQCEPTVLIVVDGYRYGRKTISRLAEIERIRSALPHLRATVVVPYLDPSPGRLPHSIDWEDLTSEWEPPAFALVSFDHPLYVLYTSGTTGLPKAIVHGHGGMLLEHTKALALHMDLGPDDRFFWYTTTGWMIWNYLVSGLLVGSSIVLFDGDPGYPDLMTQWRTAAETGVTYLGASAPFLMRCLRDGLRPGDALDLKAIRGVASSGAPLPASGDRWVYAAVGSDLHLGSFSGGTDVCTGFVGPSPLVPVWAGEISCRMLGARVESFDAHGHSMVGAEGELVITAPMPSMPVGLLDDPDGARYRAAYFTRYEGVWRHGDWVTITDRGSCVISGRSDATLNRGGVRIGTAEFYAVVESLPEVEDSVVVHLEDPGGDVGELIMLVVLGDGLALTDDLKDDIASVLRDRLSPRHVPDLMLAVPTLPRTLTGKKLEVPIKRILSGTPLSEVIAPGTLADPTALEPIIELARSRGLPG